MLSPAMDKIYTTQTKYIATQTKYIIEKDTVFLALYPHIFYTNKSLYCSIYLALFSSSKADIASHKFFLSIN